MREERRTVARASASTGYTVGSFDVGVDFLVDQLSIVMVLVVTGVGTLIHVYSIGYMHGDARFSRFFAYLNLFAASMLLLVLADNLLLLYVGWEGVGLCSYLLIGFWFEKPAAANAAKKAFIVNRIGDFSFLLGIFLAGVGPSGRLTRRARSTSAGRSDDARGSRPIAALLLFGGATGQERADTALRLASGCDGGPDSGFGADPRGDDGHGRRLHGRPASARCSRPRGRRCLAGRRLDRRAHRACGPRSWRRPSTTSSACSPIRPCRSSATCSSRTACGAYSAGIFHLVTHAFFKALMFLGAGAVMHALARRDRHAQDGRPAQGDADHRVDVHGGLARDLRGRSVRGLLLEGRDPGFGVGRGRVRAVGRSAS